MLTALLLGLLVVSLAAGGWGHSRYGLMGWSPAAILLFLLLVVLLSGART